MKKKAQGSGNGLLLIGTHAEEDVEKAILMFMSGVAALALGTHPIIFLVSKGTNLARKNYAEKMPRIEGMEPLENLIRAYLDMGGEIHICIPCKESRGIKDHEFIDQVRFSNMMDMIELVNLSDKVLVL